MLHKKTTLSIDSDQGKCSFEFDNIDDVTLEQMFTAFRGLLISQTWSEDVINNYILNLSEEINESSLINTLEQH